MKTGKKLLALLLAVVMTMSLLTVGAFAEETPSSETPLEQQDSGSGNIPDDPAEVLFWISLHKWVCSVHYCPASYHI